MNKDLIEDRYEHSLRKLHYCVGCGKDKDLGVTVCWECFKYRKNPLKDFDGSVYEWLVDIGQVASGF